MERHGFTMKSPEEIREQTELVALSRILEEGRSEPQNESEFAESLRSLRQTTKRGEESTAELAELREIAGENLAASIEELVTDGTYLAEGNYGMVYQVNFERLPRAQRNLLRHYGVRFEDESPVGASKILKVAHPGEAEDEHRRLQRAHSILQNVQRDGRPLADVPRPIGFISGVKTTDVLQQALRGASNTLKTPPTHAEVIFMEYIEGKDLATRIYEFVLLRTGMTQEVIDHLSFIEKMAEAGARIGFSTPGGKGATEAARMFEEGVVLRENRQKLIDFLRRHKGHQDFPITSQLLSTVRNTLDVFRENRFGHNDLHERNIMTTGAGKPYVVDFGRRSEEASDDYALVRMYESLLREDEEDIVGELRGREDRVLTPEREEDINAVGNALLHEDEEHRYMLLVHQLQRLRPDNFAVITSAAITRAQGPEKATLAERLSLFLEQAIRDEHVPLPAQRRIRRIRESGYFF